MKSAASVSRSAQLLATLSASVPLAMAAPITDPTCDCFVTDNGIVFTEHKVFDFAPLSGMDGLGVPPKITDLESDEAAGLTSSYFKSSDFADFFSVQAWHTDAGSIYRQNSRNNVYIQENPDDPTSTYLTLRTHRNGDYQSTAEVESTKTDIRTVSLRAYARTTGDGGACTGIFTYKNHTDGRPYESDIEHLTNDPATSVRYTRHPETEDEDQVGHTVEAPLPDGADRGSWIEYRMDMLEGSTTWYADGQEAVEFSHDRRPIPTSQVLMNVWSQGGAGWEGTMETGGSAFMNVYWLSLVYNNTASAGQTSCSKTCDV